MSTTTRKSSRASKASRVDELIALIRAGDDRAFASLVRELEPFVRGASMRVCRDRAVADETAQDTLVAMHRSLDQFSAASAFTTWLYTVIVNNCRMKRRRRARHVAHVPFEEEHGAHRSDESPEARLLNDELQRILGRAIEELPEEARAVFVLRQLDRLSTRRTAEQLGISEAAVKSRLHRARVQVRRSVEAHLGDRGS